MSINPWDASTASGPSIGKENPFANNEANPYAAPMADYAMAQPQFVGGVFRWKNTQLVMHKSAVLPPRCIKTADSAETYVKRTLYWHHPLLMLLAIFPGLLIYLIVSLIVRKKAVVSIPLTNRVRSKLRSRIAIGIFALVLAFVGLFGGMANADSLEILIPISVLLFFTLLITSVVFLFLARLVTPVKITDEFLVMKGVSPLYLAMLPEWPYGAELP